MLTNHKGNRCIYNPKVFCQEGYCQNCNLSRGGINGICKAEDLIKEITFRYHGIGKVWIFDETDNELMETN